MLKSANSNKATREAVNEGLLLAAETNQDIVVLTADLAESVKVDKFRQKYPHRFFDVGVAEQNLAGVAAGLALSGKIPLIGSYGAFSPARNWDQIRVSICINKANVKIVGGHGGFSAGPDGATHQALEDIAITRVLPNLVVLEPSDFFEAKKAVLAALSHQGPVYIRTHKQPIPNITKEDSEFEIGKAYVLLPGSHITVITAGPILNEVLQAVEALRKENIMCELINCPTIKPLDAKTIVDSARKTSKVVVIEEHQLIGGLGSAVCELLSKEQPTKTLVLGMQDTFSESGEYKELITKYKLDAASLKDQIYKFSK